MCRRCGNHAPLPVVIVSAPKWSPEGGELMEEINRIKLPHDPIISLDQYIDGPSDTCSHPGRAVAANPHLVDVVTRMLNRSSRSSMGGVRVHIRTSTRPVVAYIVGEKEVEMLNALEVTIGNVRTPIFNAHHVMLRARQGNAVGPDMTSLVGRMDRYLNDVRVVAPRRPLEVQETAGWKETHQVQPTQTDPAFLREFDIESANCRRHLQVLASIVKHAMPVVTAW